MGATYTTRLKLSKQVDGDTGWGAIQNAAMDDADSRLFRLRSLEAGTPADPNASVQAHFIGQWYVDTDSNPVSIWVAIDTAAPSVWRRISTQSIVASAAINGNTALQTILADLDARIAALGTLATRNVQTRLWTEKASDDVITLTTSAEKIIGSFDRLDFPGTKDGVNLYKISGVVGLIQQTSGFHPYTVRLRIGSTGNGLTDTIKAVFTSTPGQNDGIDSVPIKYRYAPAAGDRITMTIQQGSTGNYSVLALTTLLELEEQLD